jgi:hypothetical protein
MAAVVKRRRRKRAQVTCWCPGLAFPHRENSKGCTPHSRDEAARQNEAEGMMRRLVYHGRVNEL